MPASSAPLGRSPSSLTTDFFYDPGAPWGENVASNWLFGISPEGTGVIGMILSFAVIIIVSHLTSPPPSHIQDRVENIRVPRSA